jgi:hypothetical protein
LYPSLLVCMWYTYCVTDLATFESDAVAIEVDESEARMFGVHMAYKLVEALPELSNNGLCVIVYDIDDRPVSIVPLDPIQ